MKITNQNQNEHKYKNKRMIKIAMELKIINK